MHAAGWSPADPITLETSLEIAGSVLLDRPYRDAPVSPLFDQGRREDLAFGKEVGSSADQRHHVCFWKTLDSGSEGRPLWLGSVTFDRSSGLSRYTGQINHHITPRRSRQIPDGHHHLFRDGSRTDAERAEWRRRSVLYGRRDPDGGACRGRSSSDTSADRTSHPPDRVAEGRDLEARSRRPGQVTGGLEGGVPQSLVLRERQTPPP